MIVNGKRYKGLQAYKERGKDSYLYVHTDSAYMTGHSKEKPYGYLTYEAYAGLTETTRLPNCTTSVSDEWLRENAREMSFRKLPDDVQKHLTWYVSP